MKIKQYLFLVFLLCFVNTISLAQGQKPQLSTKSKKARNAYELADQYFSAGMFTQAIKELDKAILEDSLFYEAYAMMGDVLMNTKDYNKAVYNYDKAVRINGPEMPSNYLYLGKAYFQLNQYKKAISAFERYKSFDVPGGNAAKEANYLIRVAEARDRIMAKPVPFNPINMGEYINSKYDEYLPSLTADENTILITRRDIIDEGKAYTLNNSQEDFFQGIKVDGKWAKCFNMGVPINSKGNEGAECISSDGNYIFYTACERPGGLGSCDIYFTYRIGNHWTPPVNLGAPVNSKYWDSQPSFSSDGKTLYFVSTRPRGSHGSSDIWKSELQSDGSWSEPVNLGDKINTLSEENSPFIHPDGKTLYFGSRGHVGMGGFDIFYSKLDANGEWSEPVNIGYPINTPADENSLVVSPSGKLAYYASSRPEGYGNLDLYYFELYPEARPDGVTYFKGKVFDAVTKAKLQASFELIDLDTRKTIVQSFSDSTTGGFLVALPLNRNYALNVSKNGYLFYSQNFSLKDVATDKPYLMDVPMQPILKDNIVVLNNVFFDTDKFLLRPESVIELDKLVGFLKSNPAIKIEIRGHTDNVGDDASNLKLSDNRAKAVMNYLVEKGIDATRMVAKGYGETKPIVANDTPENRQKNRRTEFKIIAN